MSTGNFFIWSIAFLIYIELLFTTAGSRVTRDAELRLRKNLLQNHSTKTRPSANESTSVIINLSLTLRQILDIDEKNQVLMTSIWFRQFWKDNLLTWNSSNYDCVTELHLTKEEIWVPDMSIYNTASNDGILYHRLDTDVILKHDGQVSWLAPVQVKTECKINVKYFPFDEQICNVIFGSWTYHGLKVDLHPGEVGIENFVENTEWELIEVYFTRQEKIYPCCKEPYPSITMHIRIRRRALFYLFNLVIPCGVIALLASLAFFLPSNNGERISLVVTVLLSLTVYMLIVSETMPPTSEVVPLIGKFYISTMVLIALTLVAVCISLNCCEQERRMSGWMRQIFVNVIARIMCVLKEPPNRTNPLGFRVNEAFVVSNNIERIQNVDAKQKQDDKAYFQTQNKEKSNHRDVGALKTTSVKNEKPSSIFEDTLLQQKIKTQNENREIKSEWKIASKALDRVFFLIFLITFFLMLTIVFSEAPHIALT